MNEKSGEVASVVPEAVRELLEQRSTYREWLDRLAEVGAQYRSEVAERVRGDYEARLETVGQELEEHRHDLVSSMDERRGRLDELSEGFERRSAELEEAELRFQVGEFDDGTWETKRAELTEGLEEIEAELGEARGAVEELERVLGELSSGSGATGEPDASARPRLKALDGGAGGAAVDDTDDTVEDTGDAGDDAPDAGVEDEPGETETPDIGAEAADVRATTASGGPEAAPDVETADDEVAEPAEASDAADQIPVAASGPPSEEEGAAEAEEESGAPEQAAEAEEYRDELEFLESLSLDDPDSFDAVSRMLEDEEDR